MGTSKADLLDDIVLEEVVATLGDLIEIVRGRGLAESEQFLAMAKLHLLIEMNSVSDAEFRTLCDMLEGKTRATAPNRRLRALSRRHRRDAEARLTQSAAQLSEPRRRTPRNRGRQ